MELIYCYMGVIDEIELDLEFNFSEDFHIKYDKKSMAININKVERKIPKFFYGENMSNLNLIIGKNGSRKTTLLNLIGTKIINRRYLFSNKDKWFIIYHNKNEHFIIEGYNWDILSDIKKIKGLRDDFWLSVEYSFENKNLFNIKYIQEDAADLPSKLMYFYRPTNFSRINNPFGEEFTLSFKREYLKSRSLLNEYYFLKDDFPGFDEVHQKIEYSITFSLNSKRFFENRNKEKLNLYGTNKLIFEDELYKILIKDAKTYNYTDREKFVLYFLESRIISAWNSKDIETVGDGYFNESTVLWSGDELVEIDNLNKTLELEAYINVKKYLLKVLNILSSKLVSINLDIEIENNYYFIAYEHFVEKVEQVELEYFISFNKIIFCIDKENIVSNNIIKLLKLLDYYNQVDETQINDLSNLLNIKILKLSDGQANLIKQFSEIKSGIYGIPEDTKLENIVVLLDEPELFLHPNWSRKYINQLLKYINSLEIDCKFHVIIATHSPFLLSDIPGSSVIKIENNEGQFKIGSSNGGYALNYYDLIKDSFFLDSPIGEFAEEKINKIIKSIDELVLNSEQDTVNSLERNIALIGDENIRNQLVKRLDIRLKYKEDNNFEVKKLNSEILKLKKELEDYKK